MVQTAKSVNITWRSNQSIA